MNVNELILIISYGNYARPILEYLENLCSDKEIVIYITLLKKSWVIRSEDVLQEIEKIMNKINNKGLYFLLLSDKLDILLSLKNETAFKKLYKSLRKNYNKIPPSVRNIIGNGLKANKTYFSDINETRIWGEGYVQDNADIAIEYNIKGRKLLNKGKKTEASMEFVKSFEYALKYPHSTLIFTGLNRSVWYLKEEDKEKSLHLSKTLEYYCGYLSDDSYILIAKLDTIITVLKINNDDSYYKTAEIMLFYYELLLKKAPEYEKRYAKKIEKAKKLTKHFYVKPYEKKLKIKNNKNIQNYFNKQIEKPNSFCKEFGFSSQTIYSILNGNAKNIAKSTIRKLIEALELKLNFSNPREINYEILWMKEEKNFEDNFKVFHDISVFELKKSILKTYMSLIVCEGINISEILNLADKSVFELHEYAKSNERTVIFFNRIFNVGIPFYNGRQDLIEKMFERMDFEGDGERHVEVLIDIYKKIGASKKNKECELLNLFFRNYARYDIEWNFDVKEIMKDRKFDENYEIIEQFCNHINLPSIYGYISYWCFEKDCRNEFIDLIKKL